MKPENNKKFQGKKNGKGSRYSKRPTSKDTTTEWKEGSNDWQWYAATEQLLKDAASFPFSYPLGSKVGQYAPSGTYQDYSFPGIMALSLTPLIGISKDPVSAVNTAAGQIYTTVRKANSGARNYEPADLMMHILSADSVFSMYTHLLRAYSVACEYQLYNRYLPKALLEVMGIDAEDLTTAGLADFRAGLNSAAYAMSVIKVPKGLKLFDRHMFLYSRIFADSPGKKAQMYVYVPELFYKFDGTSLETGSALKPVYPRHNGYTSANRPTPISYKVWLERLFDLIWAIRTNEDQIYLMNGDLEKAYGENGFFEFHTIPETLPFACTYDTEVLNQIKNSTTVGFMASLNDPSSWIRQDNGHAIICDPIFLENNSAAYRLKESMPGIIFSSHTDSPSPAEVMVGSRLTNFPLVNAYDLTNAKHLITAGSEVVSCFEVYYLLDGVSQYTGFSSVMDATPTLLIDSQSNPTVNQEDTVAVLSALSRVSSFNDHPAMYVAYGPETAKRFAPMFDVDNYTILTQQDLVKMNDIAMLGMFNIPGPGETRLK